MQHVFRRHSPLLAEIERQNRLLWLELRSGQTTPVEADKLREVAHTPTSGSKPLFTLESPAGERYVFKLGEPALLAAEVTAYELRCLANRPCIPAMCLQLTLPEHGPLDGLLKPFVSWDPELQLGTDTTTWTDVQRHAMLMEHAWEWFLDNLDTNASQFALLGPARFPLNADWDRAFNQDGTSELSRFAKYRGTLPSARTFLYADYVEGRIDLHFSLLLREARLIRKLPKSRVARVVQEYAKARFEDSAAQAEFVAGVLARQVGIERAFRRFARELLAERASFSLARKGRGALSGLEAVRLLYAAAWNASQLALHRVSHGAPGRAARSVLKRVRGRRLFRKRAAAPGT